MEYASIERELHIDATPEIVFDVVSDPVHVREWWPDEAEYPPVPGERGRIGFRNPDGSLLWVQFSVVEAERPRRFSFRWTYDEGESARLGNSLLVVFELEPDATGTRLRMTETGFRERGWTEAKVIEEYRSHVAGWDFFLGRLPAYAEGVGATR
ncbi:SRPBCC family protein [Agromyces larvae]|uniref:SRPBCC family protein n=1 Tax=Agromyces larvae TaxID=2929802 RepID=A0ABY4C0W4_9MICO|nr:SRPBCC family protein [Agromyces larvae]UOE45060.1 SRPBCC family protein [Agromyces larvae]